MQVLTHLEFGIRDGKTFPGGGDSSLASVRFDSAQSAIGYATYHGTVFPDNIPKLQLSAAASSPYRKETLHVYDAIRRPVRTFPRFVGKSPPTRLTRYMGSVGNNATAKQVCIDVWGPNYAKLSGAPANDPTGSSATSTRSLRHTRAPECPRRRMNTQRATGGSGTDLRDRFTGSTTTRVDWRFSSLRRSSHARRRRLRCERHSVIHRMQARFALASEARPH